MRGLVHFPGREALARELVATLKVDQWTFFDAMELATPTDDIGRLLEEHNAVGEVNALPAYDSFVTLHHVRCYRLITRLRSRGIRTGVIVLGVDDIETEIELLKMGVRYCATLPKEPAAVARLVAAIVEAGTCPPKEVPGRIKLEFLVLDTNKFLLIDTRNEQDVQLTSSECRMLSSMMRHPTQIFRRPQLIQIMYEDDRRTMIEERTADSHIKRLRKKLVELLGEKGRNCIATLYGGGYTMNMRFLKTFQALDQPRLRAVGS